MDHFYFMALNGNEILDAAKKGNASRFINHSCDPNCETQKVSLSSAVREPSFFATFKTVLKTSFFVLPL